MNPLVLFPLTLHLLWELDWQLRLFYLLANIKNSDVQVKTRRDRLLIAMDVTPPSLLSNQVPVLTHSNHSNPANSVYWHHKILMISQEHKYLYGNPYRSLSWGHVAMTTTIVNILIIKVFQWAYLVKVRLRVFSVLKQPEKIKVPGYIFTLKSLSC